MSELSALAQSLYDAQQVSKAAANDPKQQAQAALDRLVQARMTQTGETEAQATRAVLESADGSALYSIITKRISEPSEALMAAVNKIGR